MWRSCSSGAIGRLAASFIRSRILQIVLFVFRDIIIVTESLSTLREEAIAKMAASFTATVLKLTSKSRLGLVVGSSTHSSYANG